MTVTITIDPNSVTRPASSLVLGVCRNHVAADIPLGLIAAMANIRPTWGTGKLLYRVGHGITDGRTDNTYSPGYHFEQWTGKSGPYPYDDVAYALSEAAMMGASSCHVVNFGTSDPAEAARYVARVTVGPSPVALFEIGNEMSYSAERGHDAYAPTETAYGTRARQFAAAMRDAAPVPIKVGAVVSTNSNFTGNGWSSGAAIVKNLLAAWPDPDFCIFHGYPSWPCMNTALTTAPADAPLKRRCIMAQNEWNRAKLTTEMMPALGALRASFTNTEYSTSMYGDPTMRGWFGALYAADTILTSLTVGVPMAAQFALYHKGEFTDSAFFFDGDPSRPTAIYQLYSLLAQHWGDQMVKVDVSGCPVEMVQGAGTTVTHTPVLNVAAATKPGKLWIALLNRFDANGVGVQIQVPGHVVVGTNAFELAASDSTAWMASNASLTTRAISLSAQFLPAASLTILELDLDVAVPPVAKPDPGVEAIKAILDMADALKARVGDPRQPGWSL